VPKHHSIKTFEKYKSKFHSKHHDRMQVSGEFMLPPLWPLYSAQLIGTKSVLDTVGGEKKNLCLRRDSNPSRPPRSQATSGLTCNKTWLFLIHFLIPESKLICCCNQGIRRNVLITTWFLQVTVKNSLTLGGGRKSIKAAEQWRSGHNRPTRGVRSEWPVPERKIPGQKPCRPKHLFTSALVLAEILTHSNAHMNATVQMCAAYYFYFTYALHVYR